MHERMRKMTPGMLVSPMPKNPKRSTQANMAIIITPLMPKRLRQKGIMRMQMASEHCDSEMRAVGFLANQPSRKPVLYMSMLPKFSMNEVP